MKILNLYAGIGGNRKLWGNEHEITAIEKDENIACAYQTFFPKDKKGSWRYTWRWGRYKMEIHLETNETCEIVVDGTCFYQIQGFRNEEGTMILEVKNKVEAKGEWKKH